MKNLKTKIGAYQLETVHSPEGKEVSFNIYKTNKNSNKRKFIKSTYNKHTAVEFVLEKNQIMTYMVGTSKEQRQENLRLIRNETNLNKRQLKALIKKHSKAA